MIAQYLLIGFADGNQLTANCIILKQITVQLVRIGHNFSRCSEGLFRLTKFKFYQVAPLLFIGTAIWMRNSQGIHLACERHFFALGDTGLIFLICLLCLTGTASLVSQ